MLGSRFKRKYKEISINNKVRVLKKKRKYSEMKQRVKNWSQATYNVIGIDKAALNGQTTYKLEWMPKLYLRHEIFLVGRN